MKTKSLLLALFAFGLFIMTFSQKSSIELTFTATYDGQYVQLDSIYIENLTQGGDTTLFAPDTILVFDIITSIRDYKADDQASVSISQNYPNPFHHKTRFDVFLPHDENITITAHGLLGRLLVKQTYSLKEGTHFFDFYAGNERLYFLTVSGRRTNQTIKMINTLDYEVNSDKCTIIQKGYKHNLVSFKSQSTVNDFAFMPGDELRFIGFANTINEIPGSDLIIDSPSTSSLYEFEISEGVPCPGIPTVTYEGQTFNTVLIGSQCWFKENSNIGIKIEGQFNQADNGLIEKYCYDNEDDNCEEYGGLYQWNEAMQYTTQQGAQGICPPDWKVPTDEDWKQLEGEVDTQYGYPHAEWNNMEWRGFDAGLNLKSTSNWNAPGYGTDIYGFSAQPGGSRYNGNFNNISNRASFWSSTEVSPTQAGRRMLDYGDDGVNRKNFSKDLGFSVRCMKGYAWSCGEDFIDTRDNKFYSTIEIGEQCWMARNLNYGTMINGGLNQTNNNVPEKYCYDNSISNCGIYGGLYQWNEMMQYTTVEGAAGICPSGWHVPTDEEWKQLEGEVDSQYGYPDTEWDGTGQRGFDVGNGLKSESGWSGGNGNNASGFSAKPGGSRIVTGLFFGIEDFGSWWSSTQGNTTESYNRGLSYTEVTSGRVAVTKENGYSVRCVLD